MEKLTGVTSSARKLPDPEDLQKMGTYGRFNAEQLDQAVTAHPNAKVFACGQWKGRILAISLNPLGITSSDYKFLNFLGHVRHFINHHSGYT